MRKLYLVIILCLIPLLSYSGQIQRQLMAVGGMYNAAGGAVGLSGWFTCDFSGSTDWTTEGVCGNNEEWDSCNSAYDSISSGQGFLDVPTWTTASCTESYTNSSTALVYVKFFYRFDANQDAAWIILRFTDNSDNFAEFRADADNKLYFRASWSGDTSDISTTALSANTDYWIMVAINPANTTGHVQIWISTDSTITSGEREVNDTTVDFDGVQYTDGLAAYFNCNEPATGAYYDDLQWGDTSYEE